MAEPSVAVPLLKWAGGKRWLASRIGALAPATGGTYFEPFAGSAAMFFHSAPTKAVLSDVNAELIECYQAVKDSPTKVTDFLKNHARQHSDKYYYQVRAMNCRSPHGRAARFIYLNRTCWNGLYRVNFRGEFNVPRGTKNDVILPTDDLYAISALLSKAELVCSDFEEQINRSKKGDLIFADPPYTLDQTPNGFIKYNGVPFSWDDQLRLCAVLLRAKNRGVVVFVTNADHESVRNLYKDFEIRGTKRYSAIAGIANKRGSVSELIIQ